MPLFYTYEANNFIGPNRPDPVPLIRESGTVYIHVWTDGRNIIDTKVGNVWTTVGGVALNASSGVFPCSFGPFTPSAYLSAGVDYLSVASPFTYAYIATFSTGSAGYVFSDMTDTVGGWGNYTTGNGGKSEVVIATPGVTAANTVLGISGTAGRPVACVGGFDGTNWFHRFNSSSLNSAVNATTIVGPNRKTLIGAGLTNAGVPTQAWSGKIAEFYLSNETPTSASLAALYNSISSSLSGAVP